MESNAWERGAAEGVGLCAFDGKIQTTQAGKSSRLSDQDGRQVVEVSEFPTGAMGEFCSAGEFGKQESDVSLVRVKHGVVQRFARVEFPMGADEFARVTSVEAAID